MHTEGVFAPETAAAASELYAAVGPAAQTSVREVAKAMDFDSEEYEDRVTGSVVATAHEAIFASMLEVTVGTDAEFEEWCEAHPDFEREVIGNENVDRVVWHPVPFAETVVAATFQERQDAAVGTLRRQAFGSVYRGTVTGDR
ncbi:DUF5809 family protein [Halorientalis pallida]|uniref:Uncharacterized protein n=1 Tax=Halorientalis pallida TaxID=2479928 RepID=A0A498KYB5_9EURY|nr:DUF5809 family protein [Halorientalis pallida]RXK47320.1 hypothetical protein EAF64_16185 [Halorientalis pallida]